MYTSLQSMMKKEVFDFEARKTNSSNAPFNFAN